MQANINYDFNGQTAVITGGTRGIGQAISSAFLNAGAKVIATYTSNDEAAQKYKASLGEIGERLILRKFDVSKSDEVEAFWN